MRNFVIFTLVVLTLIASPFAAFAAYEEPTVRPAPPINPSDITSAADLMDWVQRILGWVFAVVLILAVAMLLVAAVMYVTAGGNKERASTAVTIITYAVIGIVVAGLAWALVNVVQSVFFYEQVVTFQP